MTQEEINNRIEELEEMLSQKYEWEEDYDELTLELLDLLTIK